MKTSKKHASLPEHPGIVALRRILQERRWDNQGGYVSVDANGKHVGFITSEIGQATPAEMDAMFELIGIKPEPIVSMGDCKDCLHSVEGHERGYSQPCVECRRPRHSLFQLRPKGQKAVAFVFRMLETSCPCPQCMADRELPKNRRPNRHADPTAKPGDN